MKSMRRVVAMALAFLMTPAILAGCGKGGDSSSGSGSGAGSSTQVESIELSQVTDPYLTTAGLAGDTVVARVGEGEITAAQLLYWLNYRINSFAGYGFDIPWDTDMGEGATMSSYFKDEALNMAVFYLQLHMLGQQEGLTPSDAVTGEVDQMLSDIAAQYNSEESATYTLWADLLTRDLLLYFNESGDLYDQLTELYYGEDSENYPTDAEVTAFLDEEGTFRVKHILLMTVDQDTNEPLDEETVAQKKAKAEELLAQLQGAEDPIALFDTLMNENSEDGGLATNPEGYVFNQSDSLVGGFREAALELEVGEISGIVETDYGYHIMLRLPIDPAEYRDSLVSRLLRERLDLQKEELGVETTQDFDKIDPADFWSKRNALLTAIQSQLAALIP